MEETKILLAEKEIPTHWYNIQADLPKPMPPVMHPGTKKPIGPQDLAPLFPMELIKQEVSAERWIEIPEEIRDIYRLWRPAPLFRARRLEKFLDTPARYIINTKASARPAATRPTPPWPRPTTTKKKGSRG